ncbi:hypothetical protein Pryu01_01208 [Paraliobacillus ryukyuensis]|uniref:Uncharacterized protein n=1 Tax=Paraliobacillus ryukyuensis TaxID=200904 RepID=A0A366DPU1_9BACI|nr:hypothetical protein DES48_11622 [Paraliobacillus ryukyuensis]
MTFHYREEAPTVFLYQVGASFFDLIDAFTQ